MTPTLSCSLTGQMGIPKPPLTHHLSPTTPHWPSFYSTRSPHLFIHFSFSLSQYFTLLQFHGFFFLLFLFSLLFFFATPALLHHLTRCSCFIDTWGLSSGSIYLHHDLILEPDVHSSLHNNTHSKLNTHKLLSIKQCLYFHFNIMENNFFSASKNDTATTTVNNNTVNTFTNQQLSQPNMAYTHNSQLYLPPYYHQNMQFPSIFPIKQPGGQSFATADAPYPVYPFWLAQNGVQNGGGNNVIPAAAGSWDLQPNIRVPKEPQRVVLDPQKTKIARIKRKLARQKSLSLQRNASSGASSSNVPSSAHFEARRLATYGVDTHRDLFNFCTPDNKVSSC